MGDYNDYANKSTQGPRVVEAEIVGTENQAERDARANRVRFTAYSPLWVTSYVSDTGCLGAFVSLFLFLICLTQYGVLAAIGFLFFYSIGAVIGTLRASRALMAGFPYNPWYWRCGNWIISFLLTVWLAGGFRQ